MIHPTRPSIGVKSRDAPQPNPVPRRCLASSICNVPNRCGRVAVHCFVTSLRVGWQPDIPLGCSVAGADALLHMQTKRREIGWVAIRPGCPPPHPRKTCLRTVKHVYGVTSRIKLCEIPSSRGSRAEIKGTEKFFLSVAGSSASDSRQPD
jgi:hypothetical protein